MLNKDIDEQRAIVQFRLNQDIGLMRHQPAVHKAFLF